MNIQITDKVLAGNMGEGWKDVADATRAYAAYLEAEYMALAKERFPGADIEVYVQVENNASGWCGNPLVITDGDNGSMDVFDLERDLADLELWSKWMDSDDAAQYISEA